MQPAPDKVLYHPTFGICRIKYITYLASTREYVITFRSAKLEPSPDQVLTKTMYYDIFMQQDWSPIAPL